MSSPDPEFLISNGNMNINNSTGSPQLNLIISGLAFILALVAIIIAVIAVTGKESTQVNVNGSGAGVVNGGSSGKYPSRLTASQELLW